MKEKSIKLANIWANRRGEDDKLGVVYTFSENAVQALAEELLKDVLDTMARANINYCAKTTYDYSVSECSRLEMIRVLREEYSIAYQPVIPREELFPVPRGR